MSKELTLYLSASPEMDPECELVGQILAKLSLSMRWVIKRTPGPHEPQTPDLATLRQSQFYVLLLGSDILAPIGVEFQAAQGWGIPLLAYRNREVPPSPGAIYFARYTGVSWQEYQGAPDLSKRFERDLIGRLISGTPGLGLDLADIEALSARLRELEKNESEGEGEERRGAGHGGVILAKP